MELPPAPTVAAGRALYERLATPRLQVGSSCIRFCSRYFVFLSSQEGSLSFKFTLMLIVTRFAVCRWLCSQSEMARRITDIQKTVKEMQREMDVLRSVCTNVVEEADRDLARFAVSTAREQLREMKVSHKSYYLLETMCVVSSPDTS
jgi:hypothetical protein